VSEQLTHPATGEKFLSPIPPGTGWPGDLATDATPVATDAPDVARIAAGTDLAELTARSSVCRACPRLVAWREEVAVMKRRWFANQPYWGRPVAGFGDAAPRLLVVGLAPAAHGGNRTGRIFTGDRSGDWLFAALYRAGFASQPDALNAADGLRLTGARIVAAVRCAPPGNTPAPAERDACSPWLDREIQLTLGSLRGVVALGSYAWAVALRALSRSGLVVTAPRPRFGHGTEVSMDRLLLVGCYHPSQQNTFTGKLTEAMLDEVFHRAAEFIRRLD
jgi:uracil-DNA glycosylase family 4